MGGRRGTTGPRPARQRKRDCSARGCRFVVSQTRGWARPAPGVACGTVGVRALGGRPTLVQRPGSRILGVDAGETCKRPHVIAICWLLVAREAAPRGALGQALRHFRAVAHPALPASRRLIRPSRPTRGGQKRGSTCCQCSPERPGGKAGHSARMPRASPPAKSGCRCSRSVAPRATPPASFRHKQPVTLVS